MARWSADSAPAHLSVREPGRFRKSHNVGRCTRQRCMLCRAEKLLRLPHSSVVRHDEVYREMLEELGLHWKYRWRRMRRMTA